MLKKPAPNQAKNVAIFQSCLLPKMRLSVNLEGRCTAYKNDIIGKYNYILGNTTFSIWMLIKESFDKFLGCFQFSTTVSQISCNRLDSLVSLFFKAPLTQVVVVGNLYFALGRPDRWTNHVGPRTHTLCMAVGTRGAIVPPYFGRSPISIKKNWGGETYQPSLSTLSNMDRQILRQLFRQIICFVL